jgi:hypothetical protein
MTNHQPAPNLRGQAARNEEELRRFLRHPLVETLDVDDEAARIYAEITVALRQARTPIPTNDVWITTCLFLLSFRDQLVPRRKFLTISLNVRFERAFASPDILVRERRHAGAGAVERIISQMRHGYPQSGRHECHHESQSWHFKAISTRSTLLPGPVE